MNHRKIKVTFTTLLLKTKPHAKYGLKIPLTILLLIALLIPLYFLVKSYGHITIPSFGEKIYREGIIGQPHIINPLFSKDNEIDQTIVDLVYRGVTKFDVHGNWSGDLAEKIEVDSDGLGYHIFLKKDLRWDDNTAITSDDVIFTYQQIQSPEYVGFWREAFKQVSYEKINDTELTVKLSQPLSSFYQTLAVGIIPQHVFGGLMVREVSEKSRTQTPTGSGEFKFESVKHTSEGYISEIVLKSKEKTNGVSGIKFVYYPDEQSLITAYKMGEIDAFRANNDSIVTGSLMGWNNYKIYSVPMNLRSYQIFFKTTSDSPINNVDVRRALVLGTDRVSLVKNVFKNTPPVSYGPINKMSWAYNPIEEMNTYDPETAKNDLMGAKAENLSVTLTIPDIPQAEQIAEELKIQWDKLGVMLSVKKVPTDSFEKDIVQPRNFELLFYGQEVSEDPDQYTLWHSTQKDYPGLNISQLQEKRVDKPLEEARQNYGLETRKVKFIEFQKQFQNYMPSMFLYHPVYTYIIHQRVKNVIFSDIGTPQQRFTTIKNWDIQRVIGEI